MPRGLSGERVSVGMPQSPAGGLCWCPYAQQWWALPEHLRPLSFVDRNASQRQGRSVLPPESTSDNSVYRELQCSSPKVICPV